MAQVRVPVRSGRLVTIIPLLSLAAASWAVVLWWMGGDAGGPGADPGPLGLFIASWTLMMAAMMLPSVWPIVLVHRRLARARSGDGAYPAWLGTPLLLTGYLAAWAVAGLVGYAVLRAGRALDLDALSWERGGPLLAGGVIVGAAVYQLTPLKDVCLRHCRGPFSFLLENWRPGPTGAVRMGARHGAWCIGCCWALMAALFALGVMSVGWMALVAVFIAVEKLLPWRRATTAVVTGSLLVLGLAVAFAPAHVPGLGTPGAAMEGMTMSPGAPPPPGMPGMP